LIIKKTGQICITANIKNQHLSLDYDIQPHNNYLYWYFTDGNLFCDLCNVNFSYNLIQNGDVVQAKSWPQNNEKLIQIDNQCFTNEKLLLTPETKYDLEIYVQNGSHELNKNFTFVTTRPTQPHKAWSWNSEQGKWLPPVPKPEDDIVPWQWDDDQNSWIESYKVCRSNSTPEGSGDAIDKPVTLSRIDFIKKISEITLTDGTNLLDRAESAFENGELDTKSRIMWQYETLFKRSSADLRLWGDNLNLTEDQLNSIFNVVIEFQNP